MALTAASRRSGLACRGVGPSARSSSGILAFRHLALRLTASSLASPRSLAAPPLGALAHLVGSALPSVCQPPRLPPLVHLPPLRLARQQWRVQGRPPWRLTGRRPLRLGDLCGSLVRLWLGEWLGEWLGGTLAEARW